jgi:hypothetical protein
MSNFWDQIKNLFRSVEESSPQQPAIHEMLERNDTERADYQKWHHTLSKRRLLDWVRESHLQFMVEGDSGDEAVDFLNTPSAKGFVLHIYKTRYGKREMVHFFDYLKERVLELDYRISLSDTQTYNRKDWVEQVDRHYLKPPTDLRNHGRGKFDQGFGNISIELLYRNDQLFLLKFKATTYSDHMYQEAKDFEDLMKQLYF